MIFKLYLRPINSSDISRDCPFLPEKGEYETHFDTIIQDIESIDGVLSATTSDNNQICIRTANIDLELLKTSLKPLFQQNFEHLRFAALEKTGDDRTEA
jgi:hypothetical protein